MTAYTVDLYPCSKPSGPNTLKHEWQTAPPYYLKVDDTIAFNAPNLSAQPDATAVLGITPNPNTGGNPFSVPLPLTTTLTQALTSYTLTCKNETVGSYSFTVSLGTTSWDPEIVVGGGG